MNPLHRPTRPGLAGPRRDPLSGSGLPALVETAHRRPRAVGGLCSAICCATGLFSRPIQHHPAWLWVAVHDGLIGISELFEAPPARNRRRHDRPVQGSDYLCRSIWDGWAKAKQRRPLLPGDGRFRAGCSWSRWVRTYDRRPRPGDLSRVVRTESGSGDSAIAAPRLRRRAGRDPCGWAAPARTLWQGRGGAMTLPTC